MKFNKLCRLFSVCILFLLSVSAFGQKIFNDRNVEYTFTLPNDDWKMTVKPSTISPNVEYVYKFRDDGHLQVRRISVKPGALISNAIRDEEQKLQFKRGFVAGKQENFRGALAGKVFNYEYVSRGRTFSGRAYFLQYSERVVYLVRITGLKDRLRLIRNLTDSIARTFKKK